MKDKESLGFESKCLSMPEQMCFVALRFNQPLYKYLSVDLVDIEDSVLASLKELDKIAKVWSWMTCRLVWFFFSPQRNLLMTCHDAILKTSLLLLPGSFPRGDKSKQLTESKQTTRSPIEGDWMRCKTGGWLVKDTKKESVSEVLSKIRSAHIPQDTLRPNSFLYPAQQQILRLFNKTTMTFAGLWFVTVYSWCPPQLLRQTSLSHNQSRTREQISWNSIRSRHTMQKKDAVGWLNSRSMCQVTCVHENWWRNRFRLGCWGKKRLGASEGNVK